MTSPSDIREWAQANGVEISPKGPIPKAIREQFYAESGGAPDEDAPTATTEVGPGGVVSVETTPGEKPPRATKSRTKSPRSMGARQSTETLFSGLWSIGAELLASSGMTPTARVIALQAPVAGAVLDREVRGTAVDKLAQPLARLTNKGSNIATLVALPLLVQVVTMRPELYPKLKPAMVSAMIKWYRVAGPELARKAKEMEKATEELGFDPAEMVDMLFATDVPEAPQE